MKKKSSLKHTGAFWAFCAPCCILFGVFFLVPLVLSIAFSFTNYDGWKTIDFVGLTNYITLFKDSKFYLSLGRTLLYTVCTLPFRVIIPLLVAVLLSALIALPAAGQKCLLPAGLTWQQVTDSAQIQSQLLDATLGADGLLTLSYSVSAWETMHALGAERIVIWRQVDETSWVEALRYDETTAALWTAEGQHHSGQVRYQGWPATAYRVEVTLFAENDQGRDSRTWSKELRP